MGKNIYFVGTGVGASRADLHSAEAMQFVSNEMLNLAFARFFGEKLGFQKSMSSKSQYCEGKCVLQFVEKIDWISLRSAK